jgi:predicted nucleic acid-binding protein
MQRLARVFIDTSELFPFTIMDVLLTLSEDFFFTWIWTDELLDEWETVIVRHGQRTAASARSVTNAVRAHFGSGRIEPIVYRDQVTSDLSADPGDRVHIAACLYGRADVLITRNIKDFQSRRLAEHGVKVMTADDYLMNLVHRHPKAVLKSFIATASARNRPPVTPRELADRMTAAGAPRFAGRIRHGLENL